MDCLTTPYDCQFGDLWHESKLLGLLLTVIIVWDQTISCRNETALPGLNSIAQIRSSYNSIQNVHKMYIK